MRTTLLVCVVLFAGCKKDDDTKKDSKSGRGDRKRDRDDDDDRPRRKKSEAMLQLEKIGKLAKVAFIENAAFPVANIPLTPATDCCADKDHKCQPKPDIWGGDWAKLDFRIDEAHFYRYSYESDGKTFVAKAVGDLDCDGVAVTYEARGSAPAGNPQIEFIEPPPNSD